MNIDYSRFDQIVHAFLANDKNYDGDSNCDMGEEFQLNILSSLVHEKYGESLFYLHLTTYWKENAYFDDETGQCDPDPWFGLSFEDLNNTSLPPNPLFLIRFHFDFEKVMKDIEYRNLVVQTVIGPELDRIIKRARGIYAMVLRNNCRKAFEIIKSASDSEIVRAIKEIQKITDDYYEILSSDPIEITI